MWFIVACAAFHPGLAPTRLSAAAVRHAHAVLREADRPLPAIVDNGLVKMLRRLVGGGSAEPKPIVCGDTKYGCDPRGPDDFNDDSFTEPVITSDTLFTPMVPGVVGELMGGIPHLNLLLKEAGEDRFVVLKFKRKGCPACNATDGATSWCTSTSGRPSG